MKVVKLHKTKSDEVLDDLQEKNFVELYAVGVKEENGERIIYWYSSGNKSLMKAIGAIEYLKNSLLNK